MQIKSNLQKVKERIEAACVRANRDSKEIQIIAVTKYASLERTLEALEVGLTALGESRWQDTAPKWQQIQGRAEWHFIGHLQTNKVKDILGKFTVIHSLDRMSLAQELERKATLQDITINCFVQVNVSGEQSKHGLNPLEFEDFMHEINKLPHIRPIGLMTMAPYEANPERTRAVFQGLRALRDNWNENHANQHIHHLSMGMSNDFEIAIEEGATMIRLGTILIGEE